MRFFFTSAAALTLLASVLTSAAQALLVKDSPLATACQGNVPVVVHSGMGAAIDFTQTGRVVQRAWLGDPSKLTLETDRPLAQGSSVLFLRRIDSLDFEGLPATASTVLTAVLIGSSGAEVCQFPISYSSDLPDFTSLRLLPQSEPTATPESTPDTPTPAIERLRNTSVDLDLVEAGIDLNAQYLGEGNQVIIKVREFIERARAGENQQATAREMEIEWALILELRRQGEGEQGEGGETFAGSSVSL